MTALCVARTLRFALGTTLAAGFAFGIDYPLAVMTPVFTAVFLGTPGPRLGLRQMLAIFAAAFIGLGLGVVASLVLPHAPSLLFLAVGLALFRIFLAASRGASPLLVLMLLLGVLLVPVVGTRSQQQAVDFASDFLVALALAFVFVQAAFELRPDPACGEPASPAPQMARTSARDHVAFAVQRTAIFLPLFAVVVSLQLTSQLQALLYAVLLSLGAETRGGWRASLPMLGGALIGGTAAVAIYLLTSMHHELALLVLLVALALLWIGRGQFSDAPSAVYFGSAATAMLILISSGSSVFGDETGTKFFERVGAIVLAAGILGVGLPVAAYLLPGRRAAR
jgi:hypothetical protein